MGDVAHESVMLDEMLSILSPKDGGIYIDATFGAGGFSRAILNHSNCKLYALDCDPLVKRFADSVLEQFGNRFVFVPGFYGDISFLCGERGLHECDGVVFDVGLSSMQIDDRSRGFSFRQDGIFDMRMSKKVGDLNASTFINTLSEKKLSEIIYEYGGERCARKIAKSIVRYRETKLISSSLEFADIVRKSMPAKRGKLDPATRTFQAIRIFVNNEIEQLSQGIGKAAKMLKKGGKLLVISFHSLEHRVIKEEFRKLCGSPSSNRNSISSLVLEDAEYVEFDYIQKCGLEPKRSEIERNPRARSARLRAVIRKGG